MLDRKRVRLDAILKEAHWYFRTFCVIIRCEHYGSAVVITITKGYASFKITICRRFSHRILLQDAILKEALLP